MRMSRATPCPSLRPPWAARRAPMTWAPPDLAGQVGRRHPPPSLLKRITARASARSRIRM